MSVEFLKSLYFGCVVVLKQKGFESVGKILLKFISLSKEMTPHVFKTSVGQELPCTASNKTFLFLLLSIILLSYSLF